MEEIVKVCKKHGELKEIDIKTWTYKNKIYRRCKKCILEKNKRYWEEKKNDEKWMAEKKERDRLFWKENKERITEKRKKPEKLAIRRNTYKENGDYYRKKCNDKQKKYRESLHDSYIRRILTENSILDNNEIPESFIGVKRNLILLKRKIKELKNEST